MSNSCDKNEIKMQLRRISGQVIGVEKMIDDERDIADILQQTTAALGSLKSVSRLLLEDYAAGCFGNKLGEKDLQKVISQLFKTM